MFTKNLLVTQNWSEIKQAENLGMEAPKAITKKTEMLFWKRDVKKALLDGVDGNILIEFNDESSHEIEFDQKLWNELKAFFKENE